MNSTVIDVQGKHLGADITLPDAPKAVILFAHGTGSSRLSPRNRAVARFLQDGGMATVLMDLLTEAEEEQERYTRHLRFDVDMLAHRLAEAIAWSSDQQELSGLPVGLFGASTGAAAALIAAGREPEAVGAVVSRGGRPDLAGDWLTKVRAPTLLIVGGDDHVVIDLNREAQEHLTAPNDLQIVAGAGHLFEEPGALEDVSRLALEWFENNLTA